MAAARWRRGSGKGLARSSESDLACTSLRMLRRSLEQRRALSSCGTAAAAAAPVRSARCSTTIHNNVLDLCRRRGFIFPGSEIYGGMASQFDYGPLGVALKNNIRNAWWDEFVRKRSDTVGLDSSILMHRKVWETAGHVENFSDPLVECKQCHYRFRADHLVDEYVPSSHSLIDKEPDNLAHYDQALSEAGVCCPKCKAAGSFTPAKQFNMLFKTSITPASTDGLRNEVFLRPETAQGAYVNFANIVRTMRRKLPLGVGQTGKAFRNEISPGPFIFRTKEFEQMELQFFCDPQDAGQWFQYWVDNCCQFLYKYGIRPESIRLLNHPSEKLAHYSRATTDIEFDFGFHGTDGFGELWGISNRGDHDLTVHEVATGHNLKYTTSDGNSFTPFVIEPAAGLDRMFLAFLTDSYHEELVRGETRSILRIDSRLAPYEYAVFPLVRNKSELLAKAAVVYDRLAENARVDYDATGSIGRRYRRHDEIGTPIGVTVDHDSLVDDCVTLRCRDTMKQRRIPIAQLTEPKTSHAPKWFS